MLKRVLGSAILLLVTITLGGFAYLYLRKPAMAPPSQVKVEVTVARLERGRYLWDRVLDCDGCHSERDFTRFAGPVVESGRAKGNIMPASFKLPGTVVAPNITPDPETGIGRWTDGEKIRAIREGIGRDGRALFPMMPYTYLRNLSDEDVYSLVAYLNSLKPVRNPLPRTQIDFPVSMFIKSAPQPAGSVPHPDPRDPVKYGEYLVAIAACADCHTPMKKGQPVESMRFGGGQVFNMPFATVVSANISPDPETGIGRWTEKQFIDKFYEYKEYAVKGPPPAGPDVDALAEIRAASRAGPARHLRLSENAARRAQRSRDASRREEALIASLRESAAAKRSYEGPSSARTVSSVSASSGFLSVLQRAMRGKRTAIPERWRADF